MTAPYVVGDHVQALTGSPAGTTLVTGAVVGVMGTYDDDYPWRIAYRDPSAPAGVRTVLVDDEGRDRHRYVERTYGFLPWEIASTPAADHARILAAVARECGIVGGLVRPGEDGHVVVVWTWPSGADRYVVDIEGDLFWSFCLSAYVDGDPTAHHEANLSSAHETVRELQYLEEAAKDAGADRQRSADEQGITAIVTALAGLGIAAEIRKTDGLRLVAAVPLDGDRFIGMTDDGDLWGVEYTRAQWAGREGVPDEAHQSFRDVAALATWVARRVARTAATGAAL